MTLAQYAVMLLCAIGLLMMLFIMGAVFTLSGRISRHEELIEFPDADGEWLGG